MVECCLFQYKEYRQHDVALCCVCDPVLCFAVLLSRRKPWLTAVSVQRVQTAPCCIVLCL